MAWTFINSMLIGQILMVIFGIYTAVWVAKIARIPMPAMAAAVLVLALFGAYSVQQTMGDVWVMFALGGMMYFLQKFGFSAAPLVLGLILGPIAESNFVQGNMIGTAMEMPVAYFFDGYLNKLLIVLVLASIAYSFWSHHRSALAITTPSATPRIQHAVTATIIAATMFVVAWASFAGEPKDAFLFPRVLAGILVFLALWNAFRAWTGKARVGVGLDRREFVYLLPGLLVAIALNYWLAKTVGFYVSATLCFLSIYTLYDPVPLRQISGWIRRIIVTAGFMLTIYALFALLLQVQTPRGAFI